MKYKALVLLISLFSVWETSCCAQDSIQVDFVISIPRTCKLTSAQQHELKQKLESIVARANAFGNVTTTSYVIEPNLIVTDVKPTEGTKVPMTLVQGELVLLAKDQRNGILYNELTIPLKEIVQAASDKDGATLLIRSIKPRDARFVRFIRIAKKRIAEKEL